MGTRFYYVDVPVTGFVTYRIPVHSEGNEGQEEFYDKLEGVLNETEDGNEYIWDEGGIQKEMGLATVYESGYQFSTVLNASQVLREYRERYPNN